jgi:hypothetical protein
MINLISIEEFLAQSPEHMEYASYLEHDFSSTRGHMLFGFIKWSDEDACCWGGPWPGNHVLVEIVDATTYPWQLKSENDTPFTDIPTIERPIKLYLAGNDDTSYSFFATTVEEAEKVLETLILEPTMEKLRDLGFVFTN